MKKTSIFISIMLLLFQASVCAADIAIESDIDFDNSIIKIHFTTEAKYNQALSVILYEGSAMGSDLSKIVKIAEIDADENGNADLDMKLSDDVLSGDYVISVSGGGSINNSGSKVITFKKKTDLPPILNEINAATQANIEGTFGNYSDIFTLPSDSGVYTQFLSLRKDDYNNTFNSINDIKTSLKLAQLFYDINKNNSPSSLLSYIKNNSEELNINIDDSDFKESEEQFVTAFIKMKEANQLTGNKSFVKMQKEALAVGVVNSYNAQNMTSAIIKYADIIGISKDDYQSNCTKYGDVEINKALHDKNFESCSAILAAYNKRISELSEGSAASGIGGGGGGSVVPSGGGFVYVTPVASVPNFTDFSDLSEAAWAQDSIKRLASAGIVSGYEDKSFKPNKTVTREEFITLIIRAFNMYNSEAECSFGDIDDTDWCYRYVASAAEKKFVSGFMDGSFGKGSNISRQDAATILYRAGQANNLYFNDEEFDFSDGEEIAEYAKEAIGALNKSGVISGFENGSFKPMDSLTRAQAVKMIENILNL